MDKILITGAGGFIATNIIKQWQKYSGINIIGVDRRPLQDNFGIEFHETDIGSFCHAYDGTIDYILHLAAQTGVRKSNECFGDYVRDNISATKTLMDFAVEKQVKKIVYASSSSVYGDMLQWEPFTEKAIPNPKSLYGMTKLSAEHIINTYAIPSVHLRLHTVYGPHQRPDMAIRRFMENIVAQKPLIVYGDGTQTRDFTYVDDVVSAFWKAIYGTATGVFNIGGGSSISVNDVIVLLSQMTDSNISVQYEPSCALDANHTWADISKAKAQLVWQPTIDITEGLRRELAWMKTTDVVL